MNTRKITKRLASPSAFAAAVRWERRMRVDPRLAELELRRALRTKRPLVIGPWLSEIGFEVLYWIPMLTRLWREHRVDPARVTVISRGGAAPWYADLAHGYVDVLEHFTPEEVATWQQTRHSEEGGQKHFGLTSFDDEVLRRAAPQLPADYQLVHPSAMYRRFLPFWASRRGWWSVHHGVQYRPLPKPAPAALDLPPEYVAVKAYFSDCFPDTAENRAFLTGALERLAARHPVVMLSTGLRLDDHAEAAPDERVLSIAGAMTPTNNLTVQTSVIAGARALVCTYGGFAYLGPLLGVPTFSFFSDANFNPTHLEAAQRAGRKLGRTLVPFSVADLDALVGAPAAAGERT